MSRRPTMPGAGDPKDSGSPQPGFGPIDDAPRSGGGLSSSQKNRSLARYILSN
jgi:hypothetical protein